ncbi:MAG: hypothetical protein RRY12_01700 [Cloacibacillus sp.]
MHNKSMDDVQLDYAGLRLGCQCCDMKDMRAGGSRCREFVVRFGLTRGLV